MSKSSLTLLKRSIQQRSAAKKRAGAATVPLKPLVEPSRISALEALAQAQRLHGNGQVADACRFLGEWLQAALLSGGRTGNLAPAWFYLGLWRAELGRHADAQLAYLRAVALAPELVPARVNLGLTQERLGKPHEAVQTWKTNVGLAPGRELLLNQLGRYFEGVRQYAVAEDWLRQSLLVNAAQPDVIQHWAHLRSKQCRWPVLTPPEGSNCTEQGLLDGVGPFASIALTDDPVQILKNTTLWLSARGLPARPLPVQRRRFCGPWPGLATGRKLRVGYASADLHHHATGMLMVGVFEGFDRAGFEQVAFSWGPDDGTPMRKRLEAAFDEWHEVAHLSDAALADLIRGREIDILVDLKGLTQHARPAVFAHRLAPVQVNYLGYPGSLPLPEMDYIVADRVVIPDELMSSYAESVVRLPGSYQPNDAHRVISPEAPARHALGLPEGAFVFCSFNSNYKITPDVFAIWMRLLQQVPDSVLWLIRSHEQAEKNLREHARAAGVAPERLVFSPVVPIADHLARHVHADLFLDTFPCGAHTTASDALWAGLPVLTRAGRSFASRVAASLVCAAGLPELVVEDAAQYEALALALAHDRHRLQALRQKLAAQRGQCPLFDTAAYARDLAQAYRSMWALHVRADAPADFDVPTAGDKVPV